MTNEHLVQTFIVKGKRLSEDDKIIVTVETANALETKIKPIIKNKIIVPCGLQFRIKEIRIDYEVIQW